MFEEQDMEVDRRKTSQEAIIPVLLGKKKKGGVQSQRRAIFL
jgi:hypothetical protein